MKRNQLKITTALLTAILSFLYSAVPALAGSATWLSSPPSNSWTNAANWTAGGPPNGPGDTATFATSSQTAISQSANIQVSEITFNSGANAFSITTESSILTISGAGITNTSGVTQNFYADGATVGLINFTNGATTGNLTAFTNGGSPYYLFVGGLTRFDDTSSAGSAVFTNDPGTNMSAGGGELLFLDNSTAGTSTVTNNGAFVAHAGGGHVTFDHSSTAANCTVINNGATDPQATGAGRTVFFDMSTAADATLIANTGQGLGGSITFYDSSAGGTAQLKVFGNGYMEISFHDPPGVTIGSIEGDGNVFLNGNQLTVGTNNLSTVFSGSIDDGGAFTAANASDMGRLKKIGTGTFSLDLANTYSGGTFLDDGTLRARHDGALGDGNVITVAGTTLILQNGTTNNYIADTAALRIDTGSTVNLNYTGTPDVVGFLVVDGVSQPAGLWGSAASGAPNQLPQFTGAGKILVTTPAARSRKQHAADNAHITLPFTGPAGIECRNPGANNSYTIIVTFGFPVTFANASVTSGTGMVASTTGNGTDFITLELTGVTNVQRLAITLSGVDYGDATGDVLIRMGVLTGDTNGNGSVNASDLSQTKAQAGQPLTPANFRTDVNVSGSINASDAALVKSKSGTALP